MSWVEPFLALSVHGVLRRSIEGKKKKSIATKIAFATRKFYQKSIQLQVGKIKECASKSLWEEIWTENLGLYTVEMEVLSLNHPMKIAIISFDKP